MEYPFAFDRPGINKEFFGRQVDLNRFVHIIVDEKKGVSLYSPSKTGKESLIRQGFRELKANKFNFISCEIDLSYVKTLEEFLEIYKAQIVDVYNKAMDNALMKFDLDVTTLDVKTLLGLPEVISNDSNKVVIMYFKEFQNILSFVEDNQTLEKIEKLLMEQRHVRYIFSGSFVNSMKYIFEEKKYFYYLVKNISLSPLPRKECVEYITSSMRNQGKVIEDEDARTIVDTLSCNIWYIKRVCSTCCSYPIGFINDKVVNSAINSLVSVLSPQYMAIMHDLTPNQVNFIRAIIDEVPRFSSTEVLEKYKLASSANVCRLKDAVKKREIITFDKNDNASFTDPMFKYWLKNEYFKV